MEGKFSKLSVGIFLFLSLSTIVGFTIWFFSSTIFVKYIEYKIIFPSSIAGLYSGSIVTYNGVQVGTVNEVDIEEKFGNKVVAVIHVKDKIKIKQNTMATLNMKGITGQMFIELLGGSAKAPLLKPDQNNNLIIPYQESKLNMLTNAAPVILNQVSQVLSKIESLISTSNTKNIEELLANLNHLIKEANKLPHSFSKTIFNINSLLSDAKNIMQEISNTMKTLPNFLENSKHQAKSVVQDIQSITTNINHFTNRLNNNGLLGIFKSNTQL